MTIDKILPKALADLTVSVQQFDSRPVVADGHPRASRAYCHLPSQDVC